MGHAERTTVYQGKLFRVEHEPVADQKVYEFVTRIGAVTMLPIIKNEAGSDRALTKALTINNKRRYYGESPTSLPGGNMHGWHETPETPVETAVRELKEETGWGYKDPADRNIDIFSLRPISTSIDYPRFFAVMRDVVFIGGKENNPAEEITVEPTPLIRYAEELFNLQDGRLLYPDVKLAFTKAALEIAQEFESGAGQLPWVEYALELGQYMVMSWLAGDPDVPDVATIPQRFEPWLVAAHE